MPKIVFPQEKTVAIACQGGGAHVAFGAGVLKALLTAWPKDYRLIGLTGASGGAIDATIVWYSLLKNQPRMGIELLNSFWLDNSARSFMDALINNATVSTIRLSEYVSLPITPANVTGPIAQARLRQLINEHIPFSEIPALLSPNSPKLLVSAIDVLTGDFHLFEGAAVTADALLASAAIPDFFPAVRVPDANGSNHYYWDGLYSENPPISGLLTSNVPADKKPDEIWIIQINPETLEQTPHSRADVINRQNELAGNLSLNQAVALIYFVNKWIGTLPAAHFKKMTVRRIALPSRLNLDYVSKFDRSPAFIDRLMNIGYRAGEDFLNALPDGNLWTPNAVPMTPMVQTIASSI